MAMDPIRNIYSDKYYEAKQLLLNSIFQNEVEQLIKRFENFDCPIPKDGFKKYSQYEEWLKGYYAAYSRLISSQKYKDQIEKITGGKGFISSEEYQRKEDLDYNFLPIPYGEYIMDIMDKCGVDRKDTVLYDFIDHYIFFKQENLATPLFNVVWKRNEETDRMELFIQLLGNTRKEDFINNWDQILVDQKLLPDYKERNKPWSTFERDFEIHEKYLELKNGLAGKRASIKNGELAIDDRLYSEFLHKYPELTLSIVRDAIKKIKDFKGGHKETV